MATRRKRSRKRHPFDLKLAPWVEALIVEDEALGEAIIRLAFAQGRGLDQRVRKPLDDAAGVALDAIRKGHLRGWRARRKLAGLLGRYGRAAGRVRGRIRGAGEG